jgi:endonuclease/exonuclease/phosphatase family metal-dependent hydrolase
LERETGDYFVRLLLCNKSDGFTWNLVVVYGDAQQAGKAPFLVELVHIIHKTKFPLMITGDFNMTRRSSHKNKPGGFNKWSVLFNSVIAQGELMEIPLSGRRYTWSNNQEDPTFELLDRVLVSPTWEEKFPLVSVTALARDLSYHTPLLIATGERPKIPPIFRFENCWFEREGLVDLVS